MGRADHFAFRVADLDASIRFYTQALGLRLMSRNLDAQHHEAFAFIELEGGNLELLQLLDESNKALPFAKADVNPPYCPHLAIATEDINSIVVRLRQHDISIVKGPLHIPDMVSWLYISDPDNNIVEFVQWLKAPTGGTGLP